MTILNRKIILNFLSPFCLSFFAIIGLVWLTRFVYVIDLISQKGISQLRFFGLAFLLIPQLFIYLLPFAAIVGFYVVFNRYFETREIFVLRNINIPTNKLFEPLRNVAIILSIILLIFSFEINPISYAKMKQMKNDIKRNLVSMIISAGQVNTLRSDLVVYVDEVTPDNDMNNVFIYHEAEGEERLIIADSAFAVNHGDKMMLKLKNGMIYKTNEEEVYDYIKFKTFSDDLVISDNDHYRGKKDSVKNYSTIDFYDSFKSDDAGFIKKEVVPEFAFRILWSLLPFLFYFFSREIFLFGEFQRRGVAKKNGVFIITSLIIVFLAFLVKDVMAKDPIIAAILLTFLIFSPIILGSLKFSDKL